jgi:hypothetical protein
VLSSKLSLSRSIIAHTRGSAKGRKTIRIARRAAHSSSAGTSAAGVGAEQLPQPAGLAGGGLVAGQDGARQHAGQQMLVAVGCHLPAGAQERWGTFVLRLPP